MLAPGLLQEPPEPPAHPLAGGGGPVLPAPGGHAAAVGAALGVAHHLPHLYQVELETKVHTKVRNHGGGPY